MDRVDPKEYLRQVKDCEDQISNILEEIQDLNDLGTKITTTLKLDAAFGSGVGDKVGDAGTGIAYLKSELEKELAHYEEIKREVKETIERVPYPYLKDILRKRYVLHKTLERISCEMGYSYRHTCRIHGLALQAIAEILKGEQNGLQRVCERTSGISNEI